MKGYRYVVCIIVVLMTMAGCRHLPVGRGGSSDSVAIKRIAERQHRGEELRGKGMFYESITLFDSCISEAIQLQDTLQIVIALNNQGTNYRRLGDLKEASNFHVRALELCDEYSDTVSDVSVKNYVRSLNGLGNVLMTMGNLDAAESLFRRALAGETHLNSATGQAINLANIGSILEKQGRLDSARVYYNRSMEMNRKDNNAIGISLCYQYLGHLDEYSGNLESARHNYLLSYATGLATDDVWHWFEPCSALAEIYLNQHQGDSAQFFVNQAVTAAHTVHSKEHLSVAYALKSRLEEQSGNVVAALASLRTSHAYEDSVKNESNAEHVHNLRLDYENRRHAEIVNKTKEEAETEHKITVVTVVSAVLLVLMLVVVVIIQLRAYRTRREAARTLETVNEQLRKASRERQLFYRGITHQLRTPLTVVLGMIQQLRKHIAPDDEEGIADLEAAQRQSGELLQLVTRLINASKDGDVQVLTENAEMPLSDGIIPPDNAVVHTHTSTQNNSDAEVDDVETEALETETAEEEDTDTPLILIAEDNDDVAMLLCSALGGAGYRTKRAADGQAAVDMMSDQLPDLVVTDIAMPRMNGLELMRYIRANDDMNHLPIIVASARVEDSDRIEGINAGAEVYLAKPFIVDELLLRVQKLLEQRQLLRRKFSSDGSADEAPAELNAEEREFMEKLNAIIDANLNQSNLNSTILCELMFLSRSQLNRKIKNLTDMDTTHYIRERRMARVKYLLAQTNKTIGEIESECGFDTQGYLSRMFRQEMGVTPSAYRRQQREK